MKRKPVKSSLLSSVGYDAEKQILEVEFKSKGRVYRYKDVPPQKVADMMLDKSIGAFFLTRIKPEHECTRIEEKHDEKEKDETPPQAA